MFPGCDACAARQPIRSRKYCVLHMLLVAQRRRLRAAARLPHRHVLRGAPGCHRRSRGRTADGASRCRHHLREAAALCVRAVGVPRAELVLCGLRCRARCAEAMCDLHGRKRAADGTLRCWRHHHEHMAPTRPSRYDYLVVMSRNRRAPRCVVPGCMRAASHRRRGGGDAVLMLCDIHFARPVCRSFYEYLVLGVTVAGAHPPPRGSRGLVCADGSGSTASQDRGVCRRWLCGPRLGTWSM